MENFAILCGWVLIVALMVTQQWYQIEIKKSPINHGKQLALRIVIGIVYAIVAYLITKREQVSLFVFEFLSFTLIFNMLLNAFRGKEIFYTGAGNKTDKILDWLFDHVPPVFFYWTVFIFMLISGQEYIVGWKGFVDMVKGNYQW
jgi:hypothetical protein